MRFIVTASVWNEMVDYLFRHRLLSLTATLAGNWRHPWFTTVTWNAEKERWEAAVRPGFVNGQDVTVAIEGSADTPVRTDVSLTDFPTFPLGSTRGVTTGVPDFFRALGVADATAPSEDQIEQGILEVISGLPSDSAQERQLRACDIVLRCTRPATVIDWDIGSIVETSIARFTVGISGSSQSLYSLHTMARFTEVEVAPDIDRLNGLASDPGYDEALVATVFFLSPPGVGPDDELDNTWTPYVKHEMFWNADHIVRLPAAVSQTQPLEVNLAGLGNAAGAQINVNQILSTQNDAFAAARQFLYANEVTGRITTPGHATPREWDPALSLDPPFPFKGRP